MNGKLFFVWKGKAQVCSATSVASVNGRANENEIWTAGHCVVDEGVLDSSAVFIPAYDGNAKNPAPFGKFVWTGRYSVRQAWRFGEDHSQDQAAMLVWRSSTTHKTLGQAVGWAGFAYNRSVNQQFITFGYPAGRPYDGKSLVEDIAATAGQDPKGGAAPTQPIAIGSPLTGGASGGAWFIHWTTASPGEIDGLNSYGYSAKPNVMYSPYQDSVANQVRCFGKMAC